MAPHRLVVGRGAVHAAELAGGYPPLRFAAVLIALGLAVMQVMSQEQMLRRRMRRAREPSSSKRVLPGAAMIAAFALAAPLALGLAWAPRPSVFVAVTVLGWLTTFVLAILQRILPFLASVHAKPAGKAPPLVSSLTPAAPLRVHLVAHCAGVVTLAIGLALDSTPTVRAGALLGLAGAIAFGVFLAGVLRRAALSPP